MGFQLNVLGHIVAAEITDLDCSRPFTEDIFRSVKQAYLTHPVLVFRNQDLSTQQLAVFGRQFGRLESYGYPPKDVGKNMEQPKVAALHQTDERETPDQMLYLNPDDPDVLIMTNEVMDGLTPIGIVDNAETWHSDGSHKADPYQAIIVHALKNPSSGGDTEFCDMRMVHDALPPELQATLAKHKTVHHWSKSLNPRFVGALDESAMREGENIASTVPEMLQPVVRTHPETGRPSIYLSPRFTLRFDGITQEASDTLLNALFAFADDPAFHYRHEWREGDLMIWDNRCLNHRVRHYPAQDIRRRHRVTVLGDRPFYRPPERT